MAMLEFNINTQKVLFFNQTVKHIKNSIIELPWWYLVDLTQALTTPPVHQHLQLSPVEELVIHSSVT